MESLRALLSHVVDYAGLFPPANLSLSESAERYAQYLSSADSWMLARFVCPVHQLQELTPNGDFPWRIAVISNSTGGDEKFLTNLANDLQQVSDFQKAHEVRARVELFEVPLLSSMAMLLEPGNLDSFVAQFAVKIEALAPQLSAVLFQPWQPPTATITNALVVANQQLARESRAPRIGLKLRMGGVAADAGPTSQEVASLVAACRDAGLCWKATAGLHQPLRHVEPTSGRYAHGFVNLLVAAVLAATSRLPPAQIATLLDDQCASNFVFGDDGMSWKDWHASTAQIRQVRSNSLLSFGSCSFDEPLEGLRQLGWLERTRR